MEFNFIKMNKTILRTFFTPITAVIISLLLFKLPLGLGYFATILAACVVMVASAIEFRKEMFKFLGFQRKGLKIKNLLIVAPVVSGGLFLLYYFILIPTVGSVTGQEIDFSDLQSLRGNLFATLSVLPFIWLSAAFGEEIVWRGYFMRQFAKFFGNSRLSLVLNILILGAFFGFFHAYQGITGQIITGIIGMFLAIVFYIRKYDLWFNIAIHGFFDTIALVLLYKGWI